MRHLSKIVICVLVLCSVSCQKETLQEEVLVEHSETTAPVIKTTNLNEAGDKLLRMSQHFGVDTHFKLTKDQAGIYQREDSDFVVRTDVVKEISQGDYTSYTMFVETQKTADSTFYNITLEDRNGEERLFVTKYTPTETWLQNKNQAFSGVIVTRRATILENPHENGVDLNTGGSFDPFIDQCNGTVTETTIFVPYACTCEGHMPGEYCICSNPPGYISETVYECIESDPTDPNAGSDGNSLSNGSGNAGDPNQDTDPYTDEEQDAMSALVTEDESCDIPGDLNSDCRFDTIDQKLAIENCLEITVGLSDTETMADVYNYLITGNQCSEEAQEFAVLALEAMEENDIGWDNIEHLTQYMDKLCQALELFRSISKIDSEFTNKMKEYFFFSDENHINLQDLATDESINEDDSPMPENVGARVLPILGSDEDESVILQFHNDHLDTATTLGFVNTFYHELVHAYILQLYYNGELLNEYPNYTELNSAIVNFLNDDENEDLGEIYIKEMHDIYVDFIDDIAIAIVAYCDYNNIINVDLDYAKKLVWGGLNGNDVFSDNLTPSQQIEAQTLLGYENLNNIDYAKGTKTCD